MTVDVAERVIARLEENLPLRRNQLSLPSTARLFHQQLLRDFLVLDNTTLQTRYRESSRRGEVLLLAAQRLVVMDDEGELAGAYPFTLEPRINQVETALGNCHAMCAFDALAVSPMMDVSTTVRSACTVTGTELMIRQHL